MLEINQNKVVVKKKVPERKKNPTTIQGNGTANIVKNKSSFFSFSEQRAAVDSNPAPNHGSWVSTFCK